MSVLPRPFDQWTTYPDHGGIDYPQPLGTPVRASGPGTIDFSGYYSLRGGWAKFITYDCGCRHGYYHFDREAGLGRGARVELGTVFAFVGQTGLLSTGPHLHHEVWNGHTSIIRPPEYWDFVSKSTYVGDGSASADDAKPILPSTTIQGDDMSIIIVAASAGGFIKKGMAFADNLTEPLTVLTAKELEALDYANEHHGIPYRKAVWDAPTILKLINERGIRPQTGPAGAANYAKVDY